jgi:hypothetical protein
MSEVTLEHGSEHTDFGVPMSALASTFKFEVRYPNPVP